MKRTRIDKMISKTWNITIPLTVVVFVLTGCSAVESDDSSFFDDVEEENWTPIPDDAGPGKACPEDARNVYNNANSPFLGGDETRDIVVTGATDFRCPYCADFAHLFDEIWSRRPDFQKRVRFYYHHYPLESLHKDAPEIHAIAIAVSNQSTEKFWVLHSQLFDWSTQGKNYDISDVLAFVEADLELDMEKIESDRNSKRTKAFLNWEIDQNKKAGAWGTPSVFVCGKALVDWRLLEEAIDYVLQ
ncbi:MAG: thioredoxin domain-containing protein [Proteobacteria bacterium]|nr:thioredoxin domain-containing protein [Pseudomonadota bacterium]